MELPGVLGGVGADASGDLGLVVLLVDLLDLRIGDDGLGVEERRGDRGGVVERPRSDLELGLGLGMG